MSGQRISGQTKIMSQRDEIVSRSPLIKVSPGAPETHFSADSEVRVGTPETAENLSKNPLSGPPGRPPGPPQNTSKSHPNPATFWLPGLPETAENLSRNPLSSPDPQDRPEPPRTTPQDPWPRTTVRDPTFRPPGTSQDHPPRTSRIHHFWDVGAIATIICDGSKRSKNHLLGPSFLTFWGEPPTPGNIDPFYFRDPFFDPRGFLGRTLFMTPTFLASQISFLGNPLLVLGK